MNRQLTAIIEREDDGYVSLCPELDIASQGDSIESARARICARLWSYFLNAHRRKKCRNDNHLVMQHKTATGTVTIPVPDHRELRVGTLRSIVRQSGLPRGEFEI